LVLAALQACNNHGCGAVVSCAHSSRSEIHFRYLRYAGFHFTVLSTIFISVCFLLFRAGYLSSYWGTTYAQITKFDSSSTQKRHIKHT